MEFDQEKALAQRYNVKSIPCFIRTENGQEVARIVGSTEERNLRLFAAFSQAKATELSFRDYAVGDLVIPILTAPNIRSLPTNEEWIGLIDHITSSISPKEWDINGGVCSIRKDGEADGYRLIVRASPEIHDQISVLVSRMRREFDRQIILRVTMPRIVDEAFFEKSGLQINFDPATSSAILDSETGEKLIAHFDVPGTVRNVTVFDKTVCDHRL